ncbi:MAG TPA: Tol-Pal system beta propeller repeat protein TolB [Candidatus Sumerlaeota bacterium]|nr:MAG: translocation protein TolB [candidate division BRC1 bacterium ADurb.BinA292]HOE95235.1 Tol-Pal system beta propeller repeat protein TolB [Candidatus Sumerlaeota bacterium]HOR27125.1 Tol-Pal system beta propeller repeat protein TolB [Candidatus Sumerlaeota bacterium]
MHAMMQRRPVRLLPALLFVFLLAAVETVRAQDPVDIGVVTGHRRDTFPLYVPEFQVQPGSMQQLPENLFAQVVSNDLQLSGFFRPPDNVQFARETHQGDLQRGEIQFAEWYRIGVLYLVRGEYTIVDGELRVEVRVYDTVAGSYIFGNLYPNNRPEQARALAHQISNDIFKRITGYDGVADTQILYVQQADSLGRTKQIGIMDADGYGMRTLTPGGELTATPAWGARGTEIYYTTYRDFNPDLEGMILRTQQRWWVSRRNGFNLSPAWNEALQLIALTLTKDGNSEIYTIDREGRNPRRLTNNPAIDSSPCWSRDNSQLVFTSDRTGSPQIYKMNADGSGQQRLTYQGRYNDAAVWSPAGPERIAYASRVSDGTFQIFTCNPDGSDVRQLTSGGSNNEDPTWSPNGLLLAFTSDRGGRKQIYIMFAADGSNVHRLTNGSPCHSPAWSPMKH